MTQGVLIFAQNNDKVDYVKIAAYAARRAIDHLNVPVSIITNCDSAEAAEAMGVFDKVIVIDDTVSNLKQFNDGTTNVGKLNWKNTTRSSAFDLTPYEETLVIDADYIINSSTLKYCWNQSNEFLIYQKSYDLASWRDDIEFKHISDYSIPFYWATVFWFKQTPTTKKFFSLITHVKENWGYYKFLYQIRSNSFRNDFAFSIAIHMLNGFAKGNFENHLPGKMFYTLDSDILLDAKDDSMLFLVGSNTATGGYIPIKTSKLDMHVMNKFSLLRNIENV